MPETEEITVSTQCLGFSHGSVGKESTCNAGDAGLIPGSGRSTEEGQATHSGILGLPLWLLW